MLRIIIITIFLMSCFACKGVQEKFISKPGTALDSSIRYGRLPNGLTYFIKDISGSQEKLNLQLMVKVGSYNENKNQLDFAHAVEHLAFKTTDNFPTGIHNSSIISKTGMGIFDYSGTTGRKVTRYYFNAPAKNEEALQAAFLWFKDIIGGLQMKEDDIQQVKGELRQENLQRRSENQQEYSNERLKKMLFPCLHEYSNILQHYRQFESQDIRDFYKRWYRPELMGLSIVGDIENPEKLEKLIREKFSKLPLSAESKAAMACEDKYFERPPQFHTVERKSSSNEILQNNEVIWKLFFRDPETHRKLHDLEGLKNLILMELLVAVVNQRVQVLGKGQMEFYARLPYLTEALPPVLELTIDTQEGNEKEALRKTISHLNQLQEFGILKTEWNGIKQTQMQFINSRSQETSSYWNDEIERFFVYEEALPSKKLTKLEEWLKKYSIEDFNEFLHKFLKKAPEDIGLIAPTGHYALSYKENEVRSWIQTAFLQPVKPYVIPEIPSNLMSQEEILELPELGYVDKGIGPSGARVVELNNGIRVILQSYSTNNGRINIHGFSPIGADCLPQEEYYSATNSPRIVRMAGMNGISSLQLERFFKSTSLRSGGVTPYVGAFETGILSSADSQDFELMLQLIYLAIVKPNKNKLAFQDWKREKYKSYENPSYDLERVDFINGVNTLTRGYSESTASKSRSLIGTMALEGVQKTDFEKAYEAYNKLFSSTEDFIFVISGEFSVENVLPQIQKYLGNIPNSSALLDCSVANRHAQNLPDGPIFVKLPEPGNYGIKDMNYGIRFLADVEDVNNWREHLKVEALGRIVAKKFWDLRFKDGFSLYMVGAFGKFDEEINRYEIRSNFKCLPSEFHAIRKKIEEKISEIKSGIISEEEFQKGLKRLYQYYDAKRASQPRAIDSKLYYHYRYGLPWVKPIEIERFVHSLTIKDIVDTANKYLKDENLYEFEMREENLK